MSARFNWSWYLFPAQNSGSSETSRVGDGEVGNEFAPSSASFGEAEDSKAAIAAEVSSELAPAPTPLKIYLRGEVSRSDDKVAIRGTWALSRSDYDSGDSSKVKLAIFPR